MRAAVHLDGGEVVAAPSSRFCHCGLLVAPAEASRGQSGAERRSGPLSTLAGGQLAWWRGEEFGVASRSDRKPEFTDQTRSRSLPYLRHTDSTSRSSSYIAQSCTESEKKLTLDFVDSIRFVTSNHFESLGNNQMYC